jgi:hypothetical protein
MKNNDVLKNKIIIAIIPALRRLREKMQKSKMTDNHNQLFFLIASLNATISIVTLDMLARFGCEKVVKNQFTKITRFFLRRIE